MHRSTKVRTKNGVVEEAAVEDKDAEQSEFMDVKEKESMKKKKRRIWW